MTLGDGSTRPIAAMEHLGVVHWRGIDAATMLTVYLVLLLAIPSNVTVASLGAYGRPSLLWGLALLGWWAISRLQARAIDVKPIFQPVRVAFGLFVVVVLVSFAAAMLRGQPVDQVSPALAALVRVASWAGVLLVTLDGVRTMRDLTRILRSIAIAAGLLAVLGLAQFFTRQSFLEWFTMIPGLSYDSEGVGQRGVFARAAGTATHPLEYAAVLAASLPIAVAAAIDHGFRGDASRHRVLWWAPVGFIMVTLLVAVSRSAIIGLLVSLAGTLPGLPKRYRWTIAVGGLVAFLGVAVFIPGMASTILALFIGAPDDPSTQSRTAAIARVPEFVAASPLLGAGFGTFLPRYYIFDNQWVLVLVEVGVLGVIAFAAIAAIALGSALHAGTVSRQPDTFRISRMLAASMFTIAVMFAFFDALSFPISAGLFFVFAGLCGSVLTIGRSDAILDEFVRSKGVLPHPDDE